MQAQISGVVFLDFRKGEFKADSGQDVTYQTANYFQPGHDTFSLSVDTEIDLSKYQSMGVYTLIVDAFPVRSGNGRSYRLRVMNMIPEK